MKTRAILPLLVALAVAGTAAAASSGTVTTTLTPNKAGRASTLSISASGPFSFSGLPKSAELLVQPGFKSSPKSVPVLCSASQESSGSCPAKSQVGSGTAQATGTLPPYPPVADTISLTLYLGVPQQKGDISAVVISGTDSIFHATLHSVGRLFNTPNGLELLFDQFPSVSSLPPGTQVTLDSLSLKAGAERAVVKKRGRRHRHGHKHGHKRRVRYSLITNPPTCNGQWTGTFTLTFTNGTFTKSLSTPCTK